MAVQINWQLVTEKERKKINKRNLKNTSQKLKVNEMWIGSFIYYISDQTDNYRMYEWKILEFLKDDFVKISVKSRYVGDSDESQIKVIKKNRLRLITK